MSAMRGHRTESERASELCSHTWSRLNHTSLCKIQTVKAVVEEQDHVNTEEFKIQSPLAKYAYIHVCIQEEHVSNERKFCSGRYNSLGQLSCVVCEIPIKSELFWQTHLQSKKHKEVSNSGNCHFYFSRPRLLSLSHSVSSLHESQVRHMSETV